MGTEGELVADGIFGRRVGSPMTPKNSYGLSQFRKSLINRKRVFLTNYLYTKFYQNIFYLYQSN